MLNSSTQSQAMIEGLTFISDLLRLYKYKESVYLGGANKPYPEFPGAIADLYANIFEYQIRLICYLSKGSIKRGIRGIMLMDDWNLMLENIKRSDEKCNEYCAISSDEKVRRFYDDETSQITQSIDIQNRILDMLEGSRIQRQEDRRDDKEAKLLETLASDYKSDKDSISTRVPGTCQWFFDDERFLNWRNKKSSNLLWVSAGPGCGKSVLSRALIDERRVCSNVMTSTVCYFFFKDGQEHRSRGAQAFSAILHQLFENTLLVSHALPSYKSYGEKLGDMFGELWGLLIKCAKDPEAGEVICIIDALDECEEDAREQLINKLVGFFSQKESSDRLSCTLKFLVTSRPYDDIEQKFEPLSGVSTYLRFDGDDKSHKIGQEIDLVIDAKIPNIAGDFSNEDRTRISDRLKQMNNRTYLWLYLTIDIIEKSRSNYRKFSSVDTLLSNLPAKVSDAYERILDKSSNRDHARILLQIIVAASRPLTLTEANIALTLATQQGYTSHKTLDLWPLSTFSSAVRNICGLFVSVHDEKLSLIHQTAREFLIQKAASDSSHLDRWQGCFDMTAAHSIISKICLDYLSLDEFATANAIGEDASGNKRIKTRMERKCESFPLLDYAAQNWAAHYTSQTNESRTALREVAKKLCNVSLAQHRNWFKIFDHAGRFPYGLERRLGKEWTALGIASFLGLIDIAESCLNEEADVNALLENSNALHLATNGGHEKMVHMLLERGADANAQCGELTSLRIASDWGYKIIVQMLLENGADVNAQHSAWGSALIAALFGGQLEVAQILLDNGADVNVQSAEFGSVLHLTSSRGDVKMTQMLLDSGADVNAQGGWYGNALQAASYKGHVEVVQILLRNGADVNARGGYYGNALQAASQMVLF